MTYRARRGHQRTVLRGRARLTSAPCGCAVDGAPTTGEVSLSDRDADIESRLLIAEEQAQAIRDDALRASAELVSAARMDAIRARAAGASEAQTLIVEAQRRADQIISEAHEQASAVRRQVSDEQARITTALERAERLTRLAEAEAEKRANEILAAARDEARKLVTIATVRAQAIAQQTEHLARALIQDANRERHETQRREAALSSFLGEVRWILAADDAAIESAAAVTNITAEHEDRYSA